MAAHLWVILSICTWLGDILTPQLQVEKTEFCRSFVKHLDKRCAVTLNRGNLLSHNIVVREVLHCEQRGCPLAKVAIEGFDALGIWTPVGISAPFLCLEPWCGLPASVDESGKAEDKKYAKTVKAGEVFEVGYSMAVI